MKNEAEELARKLLLHAYEGWIMGVPFISKDIWQKGYAEFLDLTCPVCDTGLKPVEKENK